MAARRLWIPAREVEHAEVRGRLFVTPRMFPLSGRTAVGGTLELGFRGQPRALPSRERRCLGEAHVNRPRRRQRNQLEHSPPEPIVVVPFPEQRMLALLTPNPLPVVGRPPLRV